MDSTGLQGEESERGRLPFVDEHTQEFTASTDTLWASLVTVLRRDMTAAAHFVRLLGCDPARATETFAGKVGDTVPGFRVVASEPGHRLELRGRHRFASYALTFEIENHLLQARTCAQFHGLFGSLYRAAVVGSGAHRLVTRRLLRRATNASRSPRPPH